MLKNRGLSEPPQRGFLGMGASERMRQYCELHRGGASFSGSQRQGMLAEVGPVAERKQISR